MCRYSSLRYFPTPARKCNFVSIIIDVFDSLRDVNTSVGELLDENKGGLS